MQWLSRWSCHKSSWTLLSVSAFALIVTALVMQHVYDLQPCIKCIYQRTAVLGIAVFAFIPALFNNLTTRIIGYSGWIVSSLWGASVAREHIDVLFAANPFFMTCDIIPNFPVPLHEWLPSVFAATGDCADNSWQFLAMGFPEWMQIIFGIYALLWLVVLSARLLVAKKP